MFRAGLVILLSVTFVAAPALSHADDVFRFSRFFKQKQPTETAVVQLARTLDDLEKQLNQDGTVAVKVPDIWGEARLTRHRQEFEREMARELSNFEFRINASISRSDQAFLASATAISAVTLGTDGTPVTPPSLSVNQASNLVPGLSTQSTAEGPVTAPSNEVIFQTPLHGLNADGFKVADKGINIEPEIYLDQKARYLNHLHELRRLNEGDDTSDSPGYSMNLVRVPVSIMPGSATRKNHGAEVTITATPHITAELLPTTFRELVINDLVDLLAPVVRKFAEELPDLDQPLELQRNRKFADLANFLQSDINGVLVRHYYGEQGLANALTSRMAIQQQPESMAGPPAATLSSRLVDEVQQGDKVRQALKAAQPQPPQEKESDATELSATILKYAEKNLNTLQAAIGQEMYSVAPQLLNSSVGSVTRRAREPVSSSQLPFVFGVHELLSLSYDLRNRSPPGTLIHLSDVRSYLHEELESAYDLMTTPSQRAGALLRDPTVVLGDGYSGTSLQARVRHMTHENVRSLFQERVAVTNEFSRLLKVKLKGDRSLEMHLPSVTTSLAWAIVVESALLNQRLNDDIRRVSMNPECGCLCPGNLMFCGPDPDPQAREVFAEYVKCRWPIHVFALDPQAQDQNVADAFSMRREMQLALALAFSSGQISAQNMTRYVRRLEMDMETIALNRTAAAFGHGKDVFGWRFYPRVQSPPFESTSTTIFRDLLRGGPDKDDLRRSWEIEPGMRECTAIVLMPSFITHATFDIRGNYFPLGRHVAQDPSDTLTSIEDNMQMSHRIRLMENATCSIVAEANCYRDGEVQRLMRRADQIAKKLPLQTVHARVPNENTLGGFEMFSSGITDLAPELLDFYGMPGVDPANDTTFFLVGNNFSVHDTQVLAGNREVEFDLISRQVMKVRIPAGVQIVDSFRCSSKQRCEQAEQVVDVHIATPYGVSQHLEIPVIPAAPAAAPGYSWTRNNLSATYQVAIRTVDASVDSSTQQWDSSEARTLMAPPFVLKVAVPPGAFEHTATAALTFVISSRDLGRAVEVRPSAGDTAFEAVLDAAAGVYRLEARQFIDLQNQIRDSFITLLNEAQRGQQKIGGPSTVQVQAAITPASRTTTFPLRNTLTINVQLEQAPPE